MRIMFQSWFQFVGFLIGRKTSSFLSEQKYKTNAQHKVQMEMNTVSVRLKTALR